MTLDGDDIVISGIGGRFPQADNAAELMEQLFSAKDLLTVDSRKLAKGFYEDLPERNGQFKTDYTLFDYTYFGISKAAASVMDSMINSLLQRTFEALIDAGINPSDLRGTNSSVYTGTCHSDSDLEWTLNVKVAYGIMGRNRCMNSNRISYWLDLKGTSFSTDSGWSNGVSNLHLAWNAIKSGKTDTAIVGVASFQKQALPTLQLNDFGVLSRDGITRCFDDSASGWGRSSAIVVLILQRASIAKRVYATIGHVLSTFVENKDNVISTSNQKGWEDVLRKFYEESSIDVNDIYYVEAHGSGIKEEDAGELNALTEVMCKNRKTPLLIGCVKSNMGHGESASSFCGMVKSIIALEKGIIPPNLHYNKANSLCPGLTKGTLKVVDKPTPIPPGAWVAINSHSFGGSYGHVVLKPNLKNKVIKYDGVPRLVLLADRTNDYMNDLFNQVESTPYDPEYIALLHEIHSKKVDRYFGRGYTIIPKPENFNHESQVYNDEKRPVWFVFSGMGSQWPTMGKRLMDLPIFRESIERSHKILESKGLDLIKIITDDDPNVFENILNSFVGIAAVQIALIEILRTLNIVPDGLIGHSVGELGCSYADGCFTSEQMILAAYYRGKASKETELIKGSMAAVGKGYNDIKNELPEDIEVACHNSSDSCTLSGPVESIEKFVKELKEKGIFAKAVNVSNIAYHSRYIRPAAPKLLKYLKEIVPEPKLRSQKWISTSNAEDKWNTELAQYCSAEYHTNNLLSSVLFEEGSKHIPKNAVCIEIAPHGLLQAILKRSLGEEATSIPLTSRSCADPLIFFLQALGKMYMAGVDMSIMNLYPKVTFPVSRGTPFLSNLPHWHEHNFDAMQALAPFANKLKHSFKRRIMEISEDGIGLVVDGNNIYPLCIFLDLIWELFASKRNLLQEECPVVIQKFRLGRWAKVNLSDDDFKSIYFLNGTGDFEITDGEIYLSSGNISLYKEKPLPVCTHKIGKPDLVGEEIYNELKRKGYVFADAFQGLIAVSIREKEVVAEISAMASWIEIIEAMVQLHLLHMNESEEFLFAPSYFEEMEISSKMHIEHRNSLPKNANLTVVYDSVTNSVTCGGITLKRMRFFEIPKVQRNLKFQPSDFFSYQNPPLQNIKKFANFCRGIVVDNLDSAKKFIGINILEIVEKQSTPSIGDYLREYQEDVDVEMKVKTITTTEIDSKHKGVFEFAIVPAQLLSSSEDIVVEGGFLLVKTTPSLKVSPKLIVVAKFVDDLKDEYLLLKKKKASLEEFDFIKLDEETNTKLESKLKSLKPSQKVTCIVSHKKPSEGIEDFQTKMQAKTEVPLRWVFILDSDAPPFTFENPLYAEQLRKGLSRNVYYNGNWGCFFKYSFVDSLKMNNLDLESITELKPSYICLEPKDHLNKIEQVEFSGKLQNVKVMGISKLLNYRKITLDKNLTWEIPESWSLEDGATVPVSYALAYYCLGIISQANDTKRVLVTDAMTCLGQAYVAVALSLKCSVYATVRSDKEAAALKKMFPRLNESDIVNHTQPRYEIAWKLKDDKNYVNIIVNMLDGQQFFCALNLITQFGFIFHHGKEDLKKNSQLGTYIFLQTLSFYAESPEVLTRLSESDKKKLHELVENGVKSGVVKPLSRTNITMDQLKKLQSQESVAQAQVKLLLPFDNNKHSGLNFNVGKSFLILGDETDLWIDVVEWLIHKKVSNIVVGRRDNTLRSNVRVPFIKNHNNVVVHDHQDVKKLLAEAQKMGPLSAAFYISTNSANENEILRSLDKLYAKSNSHLLCITKSHGFVSEMCASRSKSGFPSTNFIWKVNANDLTPNLEYMAKLCGTDPVVYVNPPATLLGASEYRLTDLLPSSIDDFYQLGVSLKPHVEIVPLNTFSGPSADPLPEISPFIFIPGLHNDPVKLVQSIVSNFMYPSACVKIPDINLSISQMVSFILPEIIKFNKKNYYNIVGISWGSHIAMELTKQLEDIGAIVGLILIEGPVQNAKSLVTKSLEWDLLNLIQGKFKAASDFKVETESLSDVSWRGQLHTVLNALNLPAEKEKDFCKGALFVYNNLNALLDHDFTNIKLKGPLTIIASGQHYFDDKVFAKICKSISIRCLPVGSEQLMTSQELWEIVHGSAICPTMSKDSVHECSWPAFEEYMIQKEHESESKPDSLDTKHLKFSFVCI